MHGVKKEIFILVLSRKFSFAFRKNSSRKFTVRRIQYIAKFPLNCDKVGFSINQDPSLAFRSLKKYTLFHVLLFLNLVIHVRTVLDS